MFRIHWQLLALSVAFLDVSCVSIDESLTEACTVTSYDDVVTATSKCSNIVIDGITVPAGKQLLLDLNSSANLMFKGTTKFEHFEWVGPLVLVTGSNVTVTSAPGAILDGQGEQYWDGKGGMGSTKPKFFRLQTIGSIFTGIHIKNCPIQCVSVKNSSDTTLDGFTVDVSAGDSLGGHNTDGFGVARSKNILIKNSVVKNQDDCVVVNQGFDYVFKNITCSGGHGLSFSVGLSSENGISNTVRNVSFINCTVTDSRNGIHVKTHCEGGNGSITDVTYSNIKLSGITDFGVNIQEDYSNGSSSGHPKGNVPITHLNLEGVTGSMSGESSSMAVYILCGEAGCDSWTWSQVSITNTKVSNECNFLPSGFSC